MAGKKKDYVVTLSGDRPIHEVARDLRAAGLVDGQVLEMIGSVTGSADPAALEKLRAVHGVADVSLDHPVSIDPSSGVS